MESSVTSEPIPINARVRVKSGFLAGREGVAGSREGQEVYVRLVASAGVWVFAHNLEVVQKAAPTMEDVLLGVYRWQEADVQLRRYSIQGTGHVVQVWITVLPDISARSIKFLMPFSAQEVVILLDDLAQGPADKTAVVVGRETSDDIATIDSESA